MKNKKILIGVIALVAVVALMVGVYFATRPEAEQGAKGFTVTVQYENGSEKEFAYRTDGEYLGPVLAEKGLIVMDDAQPGMFSTVDGVKLVWEIHHAYWALFVGEEYTTVGINKTPITDGGSYKLVYTRG